MSIILLSLLLALCGALYARLRQQYNYWMAHRVPGEPPQYLLGNMSGLGTRYHWAQINARIYKRYKGHARYVGMYTFLRKTLMILDPELIKQILVKDFSYFADRGLFHNARDDPLTGNLLFLDGEPWRVLRHKLSPVFTSGKMKYMYPSMVGVAEQLVAACDALLPQTDGVLELKELCARYTTDIIGSVAFGIECNSLQDAQAEFRRMGRLVFEQPRHSILVQAFMFANPTLARRLRMKSLRDDVAEFFTQAVRDTLEYRERSGVKRNDFMQLLLELKTQRDHAEQVHIAADDLSNGLTLEQLAAQAFVFFLAGFETSSSLMSFCLYELTLSPQVQQTLREEIARVLAQHAGAVTYEAIKQMLYLEQVLSETLRLHPVLPHIKRCTTAAYRIPDSELVLPQGTNIIIPIDALHHDPEYFPKPQRFDPERFAAGAATQPHPFVYLPFGEGPRNCIGMRFGKLQAAIGIITLLQHFRFSRAEQTQIPIKYSKSNFLIMPERGIQLQVERL